MSYALAKSLQSSNHDRSPQHSMVYAAFVLFNGGDSETNEWQSQNKRLLAFVTNHLAQGSMRLDKGEVTMLHSSL